MRKFSVGDRVRDLYNKRLGTVTSLEQDEMIIVKYDMGYTSCVYEEDCDIVDDMKEETKC